MIEENTKKDSQMARSDEEKSLKKDAPKKDAPKVEYSMSAGLVARLSKLKVSVAFTSYQSGILYMMGRGPKGGIHLHQAGVPKPMGLSYTADRGLLLAGAYQVIEMRDVLAPNEKINQTFDACFVPRVTHSTGRLDAHDVAFNGKGSPIFVNTRFNCISAVDDRHSFKPIWRPSFISEIVDQDRCHLNGMAIDERGKPRYATAVSRSNTIDGWRDRRADGGVVIDIQSNKVVLEGLSMPHSPRLYRGELWVLNSGTGELGVVKSLGKGAKKAAIFEPLAFCPGFVRGLSFHGNYAFVGLSKPRYKRFEGLALDAKLREADSEPWCGIQVIDITTGHCVDWFRIDGAVAELYDVEVLPGIDCPMSVSTSSRDLASLITYDGRVRAPVIEQSESVKVLMDPERVSNEPDKVETPNASSGTNDL